MTKTPVRKLHVVSRRELRRLEAARPGRARLSLVRTLADRGRIIQMPRRGCGAGEDEPSIA